MVICPSCSVLFPYEAMNWEPYWIQTSALEASQNWAMSLDWRRTTESRQGKVPRWASTGHPCTIPVAISSLLGLSPAFVSTSPVSSCIRLDPEDSRCVCLEVVQPPIPLVDYHYLRVSSSENDHSGIYIYI